MRRVCLGLACLAGVFAFAAAASAADLAAVADANTDSASPSTNFGSNGVLGVASGRVALIRFDAAQVRQSAGSAGTLKVRLQLAKNAGNGLAVRLITGAWNEKAVTASTLPPISAVTLDQKTVSATAAGTLVSFDVSAALAGWRNNPATNFGIAIVSTTPAANLQLGSREGGRAALLSTGGAVADNDVTVSQAGGDYTDPATAAKNALQGDTWCVSRTAANPCVIHVTAGLFPVMETIELPSNVMLVGKQKGETILLSKAADFAVLLSQTTTEGSLISDLTLVAPSIGVRGGIVKLERVSLRAGSTALDMHDGGSVTLIDSEVNVRDDRQTNVIGIDFEHSGGDIRFTRSRLTGFSTQGGVYGINVSEGLSGSEIVIEDSTLTVTGVTASGIGSSDEFLGLSLYRSNLNALGRFSASGVAAEGLWMQAISAHLVAYSSNTGDGFGWAGKNGVMDETSIDARTRALRLSEAIDQGPGPGDVGLVALRSHFVSAGVGVELFANNAEIDDSIALAPIGAAIGFDSIVEFLNSQVTGQVSVQQEEGEPPSSQVTCTRVLDENLALRPTNCVRP